MIMMLIPATTPNSRKMALLVNAKTAKPIAAVKLQNKVTTPILLTISTSDCFLFSLSSPVVFDPSMSFSQVVWYLLMK